MTSKECFQKKQSLCPPNNFSRIHPHLVLSWYFLEYVLNLYPQKYLGSLQVQVGGGRGYLANLTIKLEIRTLSTSAQVYVKKTFLAIIFPSDAKRWLPPPKKNRMNIPVRHPQLLRTLLWWWKLQILGSSRLGGDDKSGVWRPQNPGLGAKI